MKKLSLCLGYFDSVHIGHKELIERSLRYAASMGMTNAVYTFREDKVGLFDGLYTFDQRCFLLKKAGASLIVSDIFNEEFMQTSGEAFLDGFTAKYDIGAFFCGYDYTFGRNASCDSQFLLDYATHKHIYCHVMPPFTSEGKKVSTTRIKELLINGEVNEANKLLGTPFFMTGRVIHGRGVGKRFGYPTANLAHKGFLPKEGVYKTLIEVGGKEYVAVTNVGSKPTFDIKSVTIESMLIDFDGDLYDKEITIKFIKYLRPIYKFEDGKALNMQIQRDIKEALCLE